MGLFTVSLVTRGSLLGMEVWKQRKKAQKVIVSWAISSKTPVFEVSLMNDPTFGPVITYGRCRVNP